MFPERESGASYIGMKRPPRFGLVVLLFLIALLPVGSRTAAGQAYDTAHQNIHVDAFVMGSYERPNYYDTGNSAYGVTGGISMDWRLKWLRAGAETRGSYTTYPFMSKKLISVGPRVVLDAGRFHPYGEFLVGYGVGHFKEYTGSYTSNNSTVYTYGGGLDYSVTRFWAIRADYTHQGWDYDAPNTPFNPQTVSVGARYMLHFRSKHGPGL